MKKNTKKNNHNYLLSKKFGLPYASLIGYINVNVFFYRCAVFCPRPLPT